MRVYIPVKKLYNVLVYIIMAKVMQPLLGYPSNTKLMQKYTTK